MIFMRNPVTLHSFKKGHEGDPLSPPKGEAACGENPLGPPFRLRIFSLPHASLSLQGDAIAAGACRHELKELQEKRMISPEHFM